MNASRPKLMLVTALVIAFLAVAGGASASVVAAGTPVYWCTSNSPVCTTSFRTVTQNTGASMLCWQDDRTPAGYAYPRWFYMRLADGTFGYVKAENVKTQVKRSNCSGSKTLRATNWALSQVGSSGYQNLCLQFVHDAYTATGSSFRGPIGSEVSAWQWYSAQWPQYRHPGDTNPPRGALVVWAPDSYNQYGHVAISLGNGWAVSTLERSTSTIHLLNIGERDATKPYAGWVLWMRPLGS
jgi:hypothetical protein